MVRLIAKAIVDQKYPFAVFHHEVTATFFYLTNSFDNRMYFDYTWLQDENSVGSFLEKSPNLKQYPGFWQGDDMFKLVKEAQKNIKENKASKDEDLSAIHTLNHQTETNGELKKPIEPISEPKVQVKSKTTQGKPKEPKKRGPKPKGTPNTTQGKPKEPKKRGPKPKVANNFPS